MGGKYTYHKPSIKSVKGLVNLGTIVDVVRDLKPWTATEKWECQNHAWRSRFRGF